MSKEEKIRREEYAKKLWAHYAATRQKLDRATVEWMLEDDCYVSPSVLASVGL